MLAPANSPEEQIPWAIIIIIAPSLPHSPPINTPTITKDMCTIEEYAIITFMSLCFRQTILNTLPPTNERLQI